MPSESQSSQSIVNDGYNDCSAAIPQHDLCTTSDLNANYRQTPDYLFLALYARRRSNDTWDCLIYVPCTSDKALDYEVPARATSPTSRG